MSKKKNRKSNKSLPQTERSKIITGRLYSIPKGDAKDIDGTDREVVMLFGVLAAPKGFFKDQHLYATYNIDPEDAEYIENGTITLKLRVDEDRIMKEDVNHALLLPIWRI